MMTSTEIRAGFLDFFRSKGHVIVPSAPIVIKDDPTLLFTNAGMNQFKDFFLGNRVSSHPRVADTQKCLRVSGKHNDLEEVGVDTYHHTMFEMLGNWSFGDYFKKEAVAWSWELLTGIYKIPTDRLYVTVFSGDESEQLPADDETRTEWLKWIPKDRILEGSKKDNFWEMGDTGPCGPCTEIHVDCRSGKERSGTNARELVNRDHPQVIEIWNNVFIQFNRLKSGALETLPAKHVDTGMGLERLVRVLQGKQSNYDTDVFTGTIALLEQLTGKTYLPAGSDRKDIAFRVLSDHIRAICFTIADGQLPSNTGAGYVIRRILRRAVRYYYSYLDHKEPLLFRLVPLIAAQFESVFPELQPQQGFVLRVIREEEEAFLRTLEKGILNFNERVKRAETAGTGTIFDGVSAFILYDTYGFPVDLTQLMAREIGWEVDMGKFQEELEKQKSRSRAASAVDTGDWVELSASDNPSFTGYTQLETQTNVTRYRSIRTKGRDAFQLVLRETPFYPESGGQVGDTGTLFFGSEPIAVTDTKRENELIIHYTDALPAMVDQPVRAIVDALKRKKTALHHTATHLLHAALRKVLGPHVAQKGSLVNQDHLRFDFSHFSKLTPAEIDAIEKMVNEKIRENIPVVIRIMSKEEALKTGAMALFGEKYGDRVRVVTIDPSYSVELCGGTHVAATGELGFFKIESESAVAAGVRRIEAVSGEAAEDFVSSRFEVLQEIRELLKNPRDPLKAIQDQAAECSQLRKKIEILESKQAESYKLSLPKEISLIHGTSFIGARVEGISADGLKKLALDLKQQVKNAVILIGSESDNKIQVVLALAENVAASKNLDAGKIIREAAPLIKGGGGGQKTIATAGGQDASGLNAMIDLVKSKL
jgi:alanyl-tRNA synthetase